MYDKTQNAMEQIPTGATVYDSAGEKLGTVAEYNPQAGYLLVEKGWFFNTDIYILVSAIARSDAKAVYVRLSKDELQQDVYTAPPAAGTMASATSGMADQDLSIQGGDVRVPVREEELVGDKRRTEQGRVHIHKDVVEEEQTVNVPLRQERATVERVPYSGDADPGTLDQDAFTERDIEVPLMGEEAVVGKRVRGVEEVRIHKDVTTDQQQVGDTVRKERVRVEGVDEEGRAVVDRGAVQRPS